VILRWSPFSPRQALLVFWWTLTLSVLACLATPVRAQEAAPEPSVYVVQPGDTLFNIAQRFGTTIDAIIAANGIADRSLIVVGQELIIPADQPDLMPRPPPSQNSRVHVVRPGEMLPSLAFRYRTTVRGLQEVNDLGRIGLALPGQELSIPPPTVAILSSPSFPAIVARPVPVVQGQTMLLEVEGVSAQEIDGWFLGQRLRFWGQAGNYWALVGVDALKPPGSYPLQLTMTEAGSGDLLTMQDAYTVTEGSFTEYNIVVPEDRLDLLDPAVTEPEKVRVDSVFLGLSAEQRWQGLFGYPLAGELRTTAPFGQRRTYNGRILTGYHTGLDLDGNKGTPIYAPAPGTVVMAEPLRVRGKVVILDHGLGVFSAFWHLSRIDVDVGQEASQGEVVGLVGNSGRSTGPHLHWEMRVGGVPVDPMQWTRRVFP
jgi:murein DD-endopeptidase MepM/ murein hydrolase activator NlpD